MHRLTPDQRYSTALYEENESIEKNQIRCIQAYWQQLIWNQPILTSVTTLFVSENSKADLESEMLSATHSHAYGLMYACSRVSCASVRCICCIFQVLHLWGKCRKARQRTAQDWCAFLRANSLSLVQKESNAYSFENHLEQTGVCW